MVIIYLQEESGRILSQMAANHRDWLRAADHGKLMESGGPCCLASSGKMTSLVLNMAASFCGGNFLSESFAVAQHGDKNSSEKVRGGRGTERGSTEHVERKEQRWIRCRRVIRGTSCSLGGSSYMWRYTRCRTPSDIWRTNGMNRAHGFRSRYCVLTFYTGTGEYCMHQGAYQCKTAGISATLNWNCSANYWVF